MANFGKATKPDSQNWNPILRSKNSQKVQKLTKSPKTHKKSKNSKKVQKLKKSPKTHKKSKNSQKVQKLAKLVQKLANWVSVSGIGFRSLPETGQFLILWILEVWKLAKAERFELS